MLVKGILAEKNILEECPETAWCMHVYLPPDPTPHRIQSVANCKQFNTSKLT